MSSSEGVADRGAGQARSHPVAAVAAAETVRRAPDWRPRRSDLRHIIANAWAWQPSLAGAYAE